MHASHSFKSFDFNDENGGTSFRNRHSGWENCDVIDDFSKWGAESFGETLFRLKESVLMR